MRTDKCLKIVFAVVFLSMGLLCKAQQQETSAKFVITHAVIDKTDMTEWAVNAGLFTVFYTMDDEIYMANVSGADDEQSWGRIWGFNSYTQEETETEYKTDVFRFNWSYANTYDDKEGTCKVEFTMVYKPQGIVSVLKMVTESLEVIEYTGYMEGSIDFDDFWSVR